MYFSEGSYSRHKAVLNHCHTKNRSYKGMYSSGEKKLVIPIVRTPIGRKEISDDNQNMSGI